MNKKNNLFSNFEGQREDSTSYTGPPIPFLAPPAEWSVVRRHLKVKSR